MKQHVHFFYRNTFWVWWHEVRYLWPFVCFHTLLLHTHTQESILLFSISSHLVLSGFWWSNQYMCMCVYTCVCDMQIMKSSLKFWRIAVIENGDTEFLNDLIIISPIGLFHFFLSFSVKFSWIFIYNFN